MANFTETLLKNDDDLNVHYQTGPKYLDYLSMDLWSEEYGKDCDAIVEHLKDSLIDTDRFFSKMFKDPAKAYSLVEKPKELVYQTYMTGCISPDTEFRPDIFSHFTVDELVSCWIPSNSRLYLLHLRHLSRSRGFLRSNSQTSDRGFHRKGRRSACEGQRQGSRSEIRA